MDFLIMLKDNVVTFVQTNLYIAIAIGAVFVFLLFRKPKVFLLIIFLTVLLTAVLYFISLISSTGVQQKQKLIQKQEQLYKEQKD